MIFLIILFGIGYTFSCSSSSVRKKPSSNYSLDTKLPISVFTWDHQNALTIDSVLKRAEKMQLSQNDPGNFSFAFRPDTLWCKVDIPKRFRNVENQVLLIDNPHLHVLDLYIVSGGKVMDHFKSGSRIRTINRPVNSRLLGFPIQIAEGHEYWLKVASIDQLNVFPHLISLDEFYQKDQTEASALGLYYGFIIALLLSGACMFILTRYSLILYTSLHVFWSMMITLSWDRLGMDWIIPFSGAIHGGEYTFWAIGAAILFLLNMKFHVEQPATRIMDLIYKFCIAAYSLEFIGILISPIMAAALGRQCVHLMTLGTWLTFIPAVGVTFFHAFISFRAKKNNSQILLLALVSILIGVGLLLAEFFGLINRLHDSLNISVYVGFASCAFFLFLHIGMKFREIAKQKEQALEEKIAAAAEVHMLNLELEQVNTSLEEKVLLRTRELDNARKHAEDGARAKASFLATMSHEIRTPMNGIIGMADLLMDTSLSPDQKEQLRIIQGSGESLLTIINDILDFSKIESGKMDLEMVDVSLQTSVEDVLDLLRPKANEKQLELLYFIEPHVPEIIKGDPVRLRQILTNLVSNAVKFTSEGQVLVEVTSTKTISPASEEPFMLQVSVKDTGIGIPSDKISKLFNAFEQVDTSTTREYGGTGLGLAICRRLCTLMQGEIWVESKEGQGATFYFTFRTETGNEMEIKTPDASSGEPEHQLAEIHPLNILVAEDNLVNQKVIKQMLAKLGYEITFAQNGKEALEMVQENHYDLVFMDVQMPQMDGLEATRQILNLKGDKVPIIVAMTANAMKSDRDACREAGMNSYLSKPIKLATLQMELIHWSKELQRSDLDKTGSTILED